MLLDAITSFSPWKGCPVYTTGLPRNSMRVEGPWIFIEFISQSLTDKCFTTTSRELVLLNHYIMSTYNGPVWRLLDGQQLSFLWNQLRYRAEKLIYLCGKTVKLYGQPCQLKGNWFWWSLPASVEKKELDNSIAAYQVQGKILIYSSCETTCGRADEIRVYT